MPNPAILCILVLLAGEIDKSTTFKIYLPRAVGEPEPLRHGKEAAYKPVRGTEMILLIEDDEAVRRLTAAIPESGGYAVLSAARERTEC